MLFQNLHEKTRSRVGKSPLVFRLSLCLVDFNAMVFRHVLLAASFFGTAGNELGQQILASSTLKFAFTSGVSTTCASFGHVWTMKRRSPFRSTLNTSYIAGLDIHSGALWTRVTLGLDMCALCTEAVHSVALWTRVTLQVWTCVHYVPKQSIP